jgi:alpha-methylacyl-CoA racemase
LLLEKLELKDVPAAQMDHVHWPELHALLADAFAKRTQTEWCALMEGTDVCFAPVLSFAEAPAHDHNRTRKTFVEVDGVTQPAPAPRFSRTPATIQGPPPEIGVHTRLVLSQWGIPQERINSLAACGAI